MANDATKKPMGVLEQHFKDAKRLLGYMARGMCRGNVTAAEDLVQDTAERMIRLTKEEKLDVAAVPLVTATRRHMANRRKHHASKAEARRTSLASGPDNLVEDGPSPELNPEQRLEEALTGDLYEKIYDRLPKVGYSRAVFDLTRDDIYDEETQAARLGITTTQVNDARKAIRAKMAEVLAEHGMQMPVQRKKKAAS